MSDRELESLLLNVSNLEARARDIKRQREEFNRKTADIANKRNLLNEQVRGLINTAKEEREKRDKCNEAIAEIKAKKELLEKEIAGFEEQAARLNTQLDEHSKEPAKENPPTNKRYSGRSAKKIRQNIQDLEWKIQTTSNLSISEEREIVEKIARLEEQFREIRETDVLARDLRTIENRINLIKGKIRSLDHQLRSHARESRKRHKTMILAFKNADILRKQADDFHAQFLNAKTQANSIHSEYLGYMKEISKIRDTISKSKQQKTRAQADQRREKIKEKTEDAKKKYEEGRKLSFEEFRALVDKGMI